MCRRWVQRLGCGVLVFSVLATACGSDDPTSTGGSIAGDDLSAFCTSWPELAELVAADRDPDAETFSELFELVDDVDPVVPTDLVTEWEAFVGFNRTFRDVLMTVKYKIERVDDELIARAFGDIRSAETQGDASDAAFASMESWAATGCGDFCTRWPELRQALDELGGRLDWAQYPEEADRLTRFERALAVGSELAPEGLRSDWNLAVAIRTDWMRWWESFDFDPQILNLNQSDEREFAGTQAGELALEIIRTADYIALDNLSDFIVGDDDRSPDEVRQSADLRQEAWMVALSGSELPEGWDRAEVEQELLWIFRTPPMDRHQPVDERLQEWVTQNCDAAGTPGRLTVGFTEAIDDVPGSSLVVALLGEGGAVTDLVEPARLSGSLCVGIGRDPWETFWRNPNGDVEYERWVLYAEPGENQESAGICWFSDRQVLAGGDYVLVAAVFPGALGGEIGGDDGLPPPTLCLEKDVSIAGDTEVMLSSPEPCDVSDWPGELAEDPWRNPPPVDPDTADAGTLEVVVPSLVQVGDLDGAYGGRLAIATLPADTTLNQLGREQVWPLGVMCVGLPPSNHLDDQGRRQLDRPVSLPLGPVPLLGAPACLEPEWLAEDPPDDHLPLALLPPGKVTVLATVTYYADDNETFLCASFDVVIKGDTVVDIAEWGECPP